MQSPRDPFDVTYQSSLADNPTPTPTPETSSTPQAEQPAEDPGPATPPGHVLNADTEYYLDGPQQSRSPDGTLEAGMQVTVIEDAGSYCRVRSEDVVHLRFRLVAPSRR